LAITDMMLCRQFEWVLRRRAQQPSSKSCGKIGSRLAAWTIENWMPCLSGTVKKHYHRVRMVGKKNPKGGAHHQHA